MVFPAAFGGLAGRSWGRVGRGWVDRDSLIFLIYYKLFYFLECWDQILDIING